MPIPSGAPSSRQSATRALFGFTFAAPSYRVPSKPGRISRWCRHSPGTPARPPRHGTIDARKTPSAPRRSLFTCRSRRPAHGNGGMPPLRPRAPPARTPPRRRTGDSGPARHRCFSVPATERRATWQAGGFGGSGDVVRPMARQGSPRAGRAGSCAPTTSRRRTSTSTRTGSVAPCTYGRTGRATSPRHSRRSTTRRGTRYLLFAHAVPPIQLHLSIFNGKLWHDKFPFVLEFITQFIYRPFCGILLLAQPDGCDNIVVNLINALSVISIVWQIVEF